MDNQENWEETQEFDLDSILSEFGSGAGEDAPQVNAEDGDVKEYAPEEAPAQPEGDDPDLDRLLEEAPAEEANQRPQKNRPAASAEKAISSPGALYGCLDDGGAIT